jgi:hypothetical protein
MIYPSSGYRGLMSNSAVFFMFRNTQIGGYNGGKREFGRGLLSAIQRLIEGGVLSQRVRNWPSLARLSRETIYLCFLDRVAPLWRLTLPLYSKEGLSTSRFGL